jgi:hypothetical protein
MQAKLIEDTYAMYDKLSDWEKGFISNLKWMLDNKTSADLSSAQNSRLNELGTKVVRMGTPRHRREKVVVSLTPLQGMEGYEEDDGDDIPF